MPKATTRIFSLLVLALAAPAWSADYSYSAKAQAIDDGRPLYSERHDERWENGKLVECHISYRSPDGVEFAAKTLDFSYDPAAPAFMFHDKRTNYREGAVRVGDTLELYGGIGESKRKPVDLPAEPVVDAGFHRYIDRHFEALTQGERRDVKFAVPAYGRFLGFQIAKVDDLEYRGEPAHRFRLRAANLLLRMLSDPVELIYDSQGRLREFIGISNIKNDAGKPHHARIIFDYESARTQTLAGYKTP
jgi:hypothetical protein